MFLTHDSMCERRIARSGTYVERGGRASDHDPTDDTYRWGTATKLLRVMLEERAAAEARWSGALGRNAAVMRTPRQNKMPLPAKS